MSTRTSRGFALLTLALSSYVAGAFFGVNGSQYDSWVVAFLVMAAVLAVGGLVMFIGLLEFARSRLRLGLGVMALAGVITLAVATTKLYSDGSPRYSYWPHALAWVALAAFFAGLAAVLSVRARKG